MKKLITYISLALFLLACSQDIHEIEKVSEKYPDGQIKTIKVFKDELDTINFELKEFYENGQLKKTGPIKDSIVINWFMELLL